MKINALLTLGALLATAGAANAALTPVYSTGFDAPTYSDGALIGQDGWAITGTSVVNPIAVSSTATNGVVSLTTTGQDVNRPFTTAITPTVASSAYLAAKVDVTAAQANGDYFIHLGDGGTSNFFARTFARSTTGGFQFAVGTSGTSVTYSGAVLPYGVYNILVQYDFIAGTGNDVVTIFVNPTTADGSGNTPYALGTTTGTDATSISSVNLRQGTAGSAPTVTVDNIAVSYSEVPEPTTLAALAGLALVGIRRNRRA